MDEDEEEDAYRDEAFRRSQMVAVKAAQSVEQAVLALPGACGLVNLGNTCYMNTAIQCLSGAPLLRSYLLSDAYVSDLNRTNPLGTEGLIAEQFGCLLKELWSDK